VIAFRNGGLIPQGELALSFADAGFVAGTAITDYCRTLGQKLFRWPDHLARFRGDCAVCGIEIPYSDAELANAAEAILAAQLPLHPAGTEFALITFATPGPFGYMTGEAADGPPTVGMHAFPVPVERYRRFFDGGAVLEIVGVLPQADEGIVPPSIKHRSRIHWSLAAQRRSSPGHVPVLLDQFGGAPDTAIASVLAVVDGAVIRPKRGTVLESIGLKIAEEKCRELGFAFGEFAGDWRGHFARASEALICGSAFGIAGVRQVGVSEYRWPGAALEKLEKVWWVL
jgi:branched-subunit amino acid aminotransferase/4-amino-4-deoxychorismate lyase